jgi:hypothetical protein
MDALMDLLPQKLLPGTILHQRSNVILVVFLVHAHGARHAIELC